jgi:hypothetical protein
VKRGESNVDGSGAVVKLSGKDEDPSLITCAISYVVVGNMPATRKFLLRPRTRGNVFVDIPGASFESAAALNLTSIVPSSQGARCTARRAG